MEGQAFLDGFEDRISSFRNCMFANGHALLGEVPEQFSGLLGTVSQVGTKVQNLGSRIRVGVANTL